MVEAVIPAHEFFFWHQEVIQPFQERVRRVLKRGSSGAVVAREIQQALRYFKESWVGQQLRELLADLPCQATSFVHHGRALPCSTREDCTPPGRDAHGV